jgi:leader peptidase (prepilin peptidase) / N-methyltransferase
MMEPQLFFSLLLAAILVWIVWVDFQRFIIPNLANGALFMLGCAQSVVLQQQTLSGWVASIVLAGGLTWFMREAYFRYRGMHGLGLGDVKFMAASGAWLTADVIPQMLLLGCLSALTFALTKRVVTQRGTMAERIAFGPHLALGLAVVWTTKQFWI